MHDAGLPNINGGATNLLIFTEAKYSAPFYGTKTGAIYQPPSGNYWYDTSLNFNAHLSNEIYGNSPTVQPPALSIIYTIKY